MEKTQQRSDSQKMVCTPSASLLATGLGEKRERLIKPKRVKEWMRYVFGRKPKWETVLVCVCVCFWARKRSNLQMCKRKRRREMKDIIWSYWKAEEKAISNTEHLPVWLKSFLALMINIYDNQTHEKVLTLRETQVLHKCSVVCV